MAGERVQFDKMRANDRSQFIKIFLKMSTEARTQYLNTQEINSEKSLWAAVDALSENECIKLSGSIYKKQLLRVEKEMRFSDPFGTSVRFRHFFSMNLPNLPKSIHVDLLKAEEWGSKRAQLVMKEGEEGVSLQQLEKTLFDINIENYAVSLDGPTDGRGLNGVKCGPFYITFSTGGKGSFAMDIMRIDYTHKKMRRVFAINALRHAALTDIIQAASPLDPSTFNASFTLVKNIKTDQALKVCRTKCPEKAKKLREALIDFARNKEGHRFDQVMDAINDFNKTFDELLEDPIFDGEKSGKRHWTVKGMLESKEQESFKMFYDSVAGTLVDTIPQNVTQLVTKLIMGFTVKQGLTDQEIEIILSQFFKTEAGQAFLGQDFSWFSSPASSLLGYSEGMGYSLSSRITEEAFKERIENAKKIDKTRKNVLPIEEIGEIQEIEEVKGSKVVKAGAARREPGKGKKENDVNASSLQYEVYLTPRIAKALYNKINKMKGGQHEHRLANKSNRMLPDLINEALAILKEEEVLSNDACFHSFNWAYHTEAKNVNEGGESDRFATQTPQLLDASLIFQQELGYIQNDNGHVVLMSQQDIEKFKKFMGAGNDFQVGPPGSADRRVKQLGKWLRKISDLNEAIQPGNDAANEKIKQQVMEQRREIEQAFEYHPYLEGEEAEAKSSAPRKGLRTELEEQTVTGIKTALRELKRETSNIKDQNERALLEDLTTTLDLTLQGTYIKPDPVLLHSLAEELDGFINQAPVMKPSIINHLKNIVVGLLSLGAFHFYERYQTGQWTLFHNLKSNASKTKMRLETALTRLDGLEAKESVKSRRAQM